MLQELQKLAELHTKDMYENQDEKLQTACTHLIYSSSRGNFISSAKNTASLITSQTARLVRSELSLCIQMHYLTC